jgi:poly-gamma-glutamate capsule biosynthesis protein CapA/YwtB (metallophosphatase superfamily)
MYFVTVNAETGKLVELQMTPTRMRRFRVNRASREDAIWLRDTLTREGERFGTRAELREDLRLELRW